MSFILLTQAFYCKNNGLNGNELRDFVCLYILADLRENKKIATYLAKKYKQRIDLIANPEGTTSPDSYNRTRGVYQEYKVNASQFPTEGSIDNLLHKANKQADHVVLVVESGISDVHLRNAMQDRLQRNGNQIKKVIVVKNGKDATCDLRRILQKDFKIEPADFK